LGERRPVRTAPYHARSMNSIITKPTEIETNEQVLYTGNHYVSIPEIDPYGGTIRSCNVISLSNKALISLEGEEYLFQPVFKKDGELLQVRHVDFTMEYNYLPAFIFFLQNGIEVRARIYADLSEKGFLYAFETPCELDIILRCDIAKVSLLRFSAHPVPFTKSVGEDKWLHNLVMEIDSPRASLSLAFGADQGFFYEEDKNTLRLGLTCDGTNSFYVAVNADPDGASTTLIHLLRKGCRGIYDEFAAWIEDREIPFPDDGRMTRLLNQNLLFNYFFSVGKDLESDRYVALTSRSPRYYVSGAFWERDSFLWSLPAVKRVDPALYGRLSRDMILLHGKNAGDHAHYIDGTVLYPGFELDEAASYFILIGDQEEDFFDGEILAALDDVFRRIEAEYDQATGLYRTFLLPSDDPARYPFVTIDNVILWRGLQNYKDVLLKKGDTGKARHVQDRIEGIYEGIDTYLTGEVDGRKMFLWSADGAGNYRLYNDPPGNLAALSFYGFVSHDDPVFTNTLDYYYSTRYHYYFADAGIRELACDHHPHTPSGLGLCGRLLNPGTRDTALACLKKAGMDYGLLSESMDRDSGEAKTGVGFATGAGYLAMALCHLMDKK